MSRRSLPLPKSPPLISIPFPLHHSSGDGSPRVVTLIPVDGIAPLVTDAFQQVLASMLAPTLFETFDGVHGRITPVRARVLNSIRKEQRWVGEVSSFEYASQEGVGFVCNMVELPMTHEVVDIVLIRENTEGEYSALEHEVVPGVIESLKIRVVTHTNYNRKKVTAVHKVNIMKLADGLFLESCPEVATKYPRIKYNEIIMDGCCVQLISKPEQLDIIVTPNLYGNLVVNTAAGIAGCTSVIPGGNVGQDHAIF